MRNLLTLFLILAIISTVTATSDYCTPPSGIDIVIETAGTWTNITIMSDDCPVCVETSIGLQCSSCEEPTPTPTPTPTPEPTPCVPKPGVWCPVVTPVPTQPPCWGFWCPIPSPSLTPTSSPTPTICGYGVWCPV